VESQVGQGSTFFFRLRLPEAKWMPAAKDELLRGKRIRIALQDDSLAAHYTRHLALLGVEVACSGQPLTAPAHMLIADPANLDRYTARAAALPILLLRQATETVPATHRVLTLPASRDELRAAIVDLLLSLNSPGTSPLDQHGSPDSGAMRVLVAEDNLVNQKVARALLERLGHTVTVVPTGREALEHCRTHSPDIIFMDVQMPEMDGLAATEAIRAFEAGFPKHPHVPIVAMTANAMKGDREKCLQAGMDDYLNKPFHPEELKAVIGRMRLQREITA
jgi:CheY-like chemotaxis protein